MGIWDGDGRRGAGDARFIRATAPSCTTEDPTEPFSARGGTAVTVGNVVALARRSSRRSLVVGKRRRRDGQSHYLTIQSLGDVISPKFGDIAQPQSAATR